MPHLGGIIYVNGQTVPSSGTNMSKCVNCGYSVERRDNDVTACPKCGGERWKIAMHLQDTLTMYDESGATTTNAEGDIVAERIQKTDLNTSANLTADRGKPSKISVERKRRVPGFEEEGAAAEVLVNSYNKLRKTSYHVDQKTAEDSDYPDRILRSENDKPAYINIQIRHLDTKIIAGIGKQGVVDADRTATDFVTLISGAIDDKANIDPQLKAKTILQLMLPAPLGEAIKQTIDENEFGCKGFKEIWISPFHEESFPLNANAR